MRGKTVWDQLKQIGNESNSWMSTCSALLMGCRQGWFLKKLVPLKERRDQLPNGTEQAYTPPEAFLPTHLGGHLHRWKPVQENFLSSKASHQKAATGNDIPATYCQAHLTNSVMTQEESQCSLKSTGSPRPGFWVQHCHYDPFAKRGK